MGFSQSINTCFQKYATFTGRACRSEFWWFVLFGVVVTQILIHLLPVWGVVLSLGFAIPHFAVTARRLHDRDMSGWWQLFGFVPLLGLVMIYFYATRGTVGPNRFGPDPLQPLSDVIIEADYLDVTDARR